MKHFLLILFLSAPVGGAVYEVTRTTEPFYGHVTKYELRFENTVMALECAPHFDSEMNPLVGECGYIYDVAEALNEAHSRRRAENPYEDLTRQQLIDLVRDKDAVIRSWKTFDKAAKEATEETNRELAPDIKRLLACPMCPGERK